MNLPCRRLSTQGGELVFACTPNLCYGSIAVVQAPSSRREMLMSFIADLAPLFALVATLGNTAGAEQVRRQRVDLIELNHFVDDEGREVFRQVIFYDWSREYHRFHVRAWRLIKNESQLPRRRWKPARFECSWYDDEQVFCVVAPTMRETWSQRDPERVNRACLPEDQRVPLFAKPGQ